jgi:uncharacterized protein (DUF427 family)
MARLAGGVAVLRRPLLVRRCRARQEGQAVTTPDFQIETCRSVPHLPAWRYPEPPPAVRTFPGYLAFHWRRMDAWVRGGRGGVRTSPRSASPDRRPRALAPRASPTSSASSTSGSTFAWTGSRFPGPRRPGADQACNVEQGHAYEGTTSSYCAAVVEDGTMQEVAWSYESPPPECVRVCVNHPAGGTCAVMSGRRRPVLSRRGRPGPLAISPLRYA